MTMKKLKQSLKFWELTTEPEPELFSSVETMQEFHSKATCEPSIWFNIEPPITLFTGREKELNRLIDIIQKNRDQKVLKIMTTGESGIGKTQLVRQVIQIHAKDYYENIIWIHSDSDSEICNSFAELGRNFLKHRKIYLKEEKIKIEEILNEVYETLKDRDTLIIFDNVRDNTYEKYLTELAYNGNKKLHSLIMTQQCADERCVIHVQGLAKQDAIRLVKQGLGIDDDSQHEDIERLLEKLDGFPLCITQATAYIQQQVPGFKVRDYIRELDTTDFDLKDYKKTISRVLGTTMTKIANDEEFGNTALRILSTVSYLSCRNIRTELLSNVVKNDSKVTGAVDLLIKYAIVSSNDVTMLNVHKLVQDITRKNIKEDKVDQIIQTAFASLQQLYPITEGEKDVGRISEALPHYESLLGHIKIRIEKSQAESEKLYEMITELISILVIGYSHLGDSCRTKKILYETLSYCSYLSENSRNNTNL